MGNVQKHVEVAKDLIQEIKMWKQLMEGKNVMGLQLSLKAATKTNVQVNNTVIQ